MDPLEAFASLDVRVGTILEAERLAGLRKAAYKRMDPFISEVLVLGVPDEEQRVILIAPDRPAANGKKMF